MARLILVDDDADVRRVYRKVLERSGHEVRVAEDGRQAIALHEHVPADVLITDILMPDMDGIEMLGELRRTHVEIKIIAMSGGERIDAGFYLGLARKLGAARVLAKPVSAADLVQAVSEVLAG